MYYGSININNNKKQINSLNNKDQKSGKYATVLFVVLMAFDRYCALCKPSWRRFRSFYLAITLSMLAWTLSAVAASPVFLNVDIRMNILINNSYGNTTRDECKTNFLQGRAFAGRYGLLINYFILNNLFFFSFWLETKNWLFFQYCAFFWISLLKVILKTKKFFFYKLELLLLLLWKCAIHSLELFKFSFQICFWYNYCDILLAVIDDNLFLLSYTNQDATSFANKSKNVKKRQFKSAISTGYLFRSNRYICSRFCLVR